MNCSQAQAGLPSAGGRPAPWGSQTTACATVCSWQQLPNAAPAPLLPAAAAAGGCAQGKSAPLPWAEPGIFSCPRPWAQLGGSYAPSSRVTYIVNCSILPGNFQWSCGNLDYQSDLGRLKPRSCGLHSPSSPSLRPTGNGEPGSSSLTSLGQLRHWTFGSFESCNWKSFGSPETPGILAKEEMNPSAP